MFKTIELWHKLCCCYTTLINIDILILCLLYDVRCRVCYIGVQKVDQEVLWSTYPTILILDLASLESRNLRHKTSFDPSAVPANNNTSVSSVLDRWSSWRRRTRRTWRTTTSTSSSGAASPASLPPVISPRMASKISNCWRPATDLEDGLQQCK